MTIHRATARSGPGAVVGKVVADQGVQELLVVAEVGGGDGHQLTVTGGGGGRGRPGQELVAVGADQRGRDERRGRAPRPGQGLDLRASLGVPGDQPADQEVDVIGHDRNGRLAR
ncbi:MAG TPA: hypothetical protein VHO93_04365 [Actinomycetota bacterium]|nr:hypothetical protein [Actinomycetota bacterium]